MNSRRTPFDEMDRAFETMRRSMEQMMSRDRDGNALATWRPDGAGDFRMEETEAGYMLLADVPGFDREEIEITVADGDLRLIAEHESGEDEAGHSVRRRRSVRRSISLPDGVVVDEIDASYRNGVLEIRLPVRADDDGATQVQID